MHEHPSIEQFIFELSEIPAADPLVQTSPDDKGLIVTGALPKGKEVFPLDAAWNALLKQAAQNKREADLDSLCAAAGLLSWNYKGKSVQSPVVLVPLSWKTPKGKQTVELVPDTENAFLNPFVRHHLLREFGLSVTENNELSPDAKLDELQALIAAEKLPVTVTAFSGIGNFHHHRYRILRELELIRQADRKSPLVETILGNEAPAAEATKLFFTSELLSPADADQLSAFHTIAHENTVIQGPPGTGKSQVLTNLLGKAMTDRGLTLVVSEKRVALDVLVKKLAESGLDRFTFTAHSQSQAKHFIQQLKATWNFLEQEHPIIAPSLLLSEQLKDSLQLLLDRLNSPDLIGGVSFRQFSGLLSKTDLRHAAFRSDTPTVKEWLDARPQLEELEQLLGSFAVLRPYKQALLSDVRLDQVLRKLQKETAFARETFAIQTFGELETLWKSAARCQLVVNESFRAYFDLHGKPRERKRFGKVRLQFNELTARLETLATENSVWKILPARSEVVLWQQLNGKKSWFSGRKTARALEKALSPTADRQLALQKRLEYLDTEAALLDVRKQLAEWGIEHPETELAAAAYVLRQLEQEDPNELNRIAALPPGERTAIITHAERLKQLAQDLWRYLDVQPETDLAALFSQTENDIETILSGVPLIRGCSDAVYRLIATGKPLAELEAVVLYSNRRLLEDRFPDLAKFDGKQLEAKLNEIVQTEEEEFHRFSSRLVTHRKERFDAYARMLRMPAAQLQEADKRQKARLKAGKAILVKEFGKSKQHLTIRELLSSDARPWIELLTPVWLSTPAQIGTTFPMEQGLFKLAIFDEASQIPLPNALGALQRSVRAVVAGDEQQMAPSAYFSGSRASVDLLHQASYYWKKTPLCHHYRSEHPALITFSNRHFYGNELVVYPSVKTQHPLHWHPVPDGIYDERVNRREAQEVAQFLEGMSWKGSIGIVAFSEQQLECIWQQCSPSVQERIAEGQEKNTVFFKALEQIQGDEADTVIISMGYGKDAEGNFHLRFGPLNQSNGHKRLNVLLTRAKSALHFFSSVTAADFAISANESVNLLRLFLTQLEQGEQATHDWWPFGLQPEKNGASVSLPGVYEHIGSAQELVTFHRVMRMRGWSVSY